MQKYIDVLMVKPNKLPEKLTIKNTLKTKQDLVGGNIEYAYLQNEYDVVLICNEEGKNINLPLNRYIGHDIIAGDFLIVGDDPEIGEDRSLTKEQIEKYQKVFDKSSIEITKEKIELIKMNHHYDDINYKEELI